MTLTLERPLNPWETRPGWGISVDLTPHEVLDARQVKVHKRLIALGLVVVALACTGVTLMTLDDKSAAQSSYDAAQARTTALTADSGRYRDITTLAAVTDQIAAEVAALMAEDVDFVKLLSLIRTGLPPHMRITNESILLAPAATAAAATTASAPTAEPTIVGSVSLSGTGQTIKDLAPFMATLNHLPGVVDVVPTSTAQTDTGMTYTLSMNVTDQLYTHHYDTSAAR
jgi:hypothetical protein